MDAPYREEFTAQSFFPELAQQQQTALTGAAKEQLFDQLSELLRQQDAVLVAHYYTDALIQELADYSGGMVSDSLEMARFGHDHPAQTLVVAGVRFMGETAKMLSPEKRVIVPDLEATCSLDLGCPVDQFSAFCDQHPARTVVVYANTSAAVKARADWVVTSSCALDIVAHLKRRGETILWAPDQHLGSYIQQQTGADMLLWQGACLVHEEFKALELEELRRRYPDAPVLVHPESPAGVISQADVVGSTSVLIKAVADSSADTFIVATDRGIFHRMRQAAPGKTFLEAPTAGNSATCNSCAHCPWMAMNTLERLHQLLLHGGNEIILDPGLAARAVAPVRRMLEFTAGHHLPSDGDA